MKTNGSAPVNGRASMPSLIPNRQVGTVLTLPGAVNAELLAEPFDFVWVDLEHGALGRAEAQEMILGAQATGTRTLVRVGLAEADLLVGPMLDAGADGIVIADVRDTSQVRWAKQLMHHPPTGSRGYGPRRSTLRHRAIDSPAETPELWVQLESRAGIAVAAAVAASGAANALIVGIADLCVDLGLPVGLNDAQVHDALSVVGHAAAVYGVAFGLAGPLQPYEQLLSFAPAPSILVHSTDARLCACAVDDAADALRSTTSNLGPHPKEVTHG